MTRNAQSVLRAALIFMVLGLAAPASALSDCAETEFERTPNFLKGPDCTIHWIDNHQLQSVTWRAVPDDFWSASIEQTVDGVVLTSSALPELVDVDQDGWNDIVTFTPIGMVNGAFDVFFYNPKDMAFMPAQTLSGHTFERDIDGYVVATGRSGPGQLVRFYTIEGQAFTFQFEINPYAGRSSHPDLEFTCDITAHSSAGEATIIGTVPQDHEILNHYCDPAPDVDRERRSVELLERVATTDRVPADTVFYCRLQGGTHTVTISRTAVGMKYAYGPVASDRTDLVLERTMDQLEVLPENGAGSSRFGEIWFANGEYDYIALYYYRVFDENGALLPSHPDNQTGNPTFRRGLLVQKNGDSAAPVFNKDCILEHSFDVISSLSPH